MNPDVLEHSAVAHSLPLRVPINETSAGNDNSIHAKIMPLALQN
jgi:hypothetical protein